MDSKLKAKSFSLTSFFALTRVFLTLTFYFLTCLDLQWELVINRPAFPTTQDFVGSISAILRIQNVYNLSARAIADGDLHQEISSGSLGPDECYELGIVSNDQRNYEDVIEWMKEALKRMSAPYEYSGALTKIDVLEYLSWAEYKVGLNDNCACERRTFLTLHHGPD